MTAATICIVSVYCASLVTKWNQFIILYSICFPTGIGLLYWTPIFCAWEHFPLRKGMATGLILGGFGFGAFIFGFISTAIANPNNLFKVEDDNGIMYFPEEVADTVPKMLRFIATIWIILSTVGVLFISRQEDFVE